jgi:hypothetical protein
VICYFINLLRPTRLVSISKSSDILVSLILVVFMITNTAMTGNYAVAQNNSNSNTSSSVTKVSSSTARSDGPDCCR